MTDKPVTAPELKVCPFCGGSASVSVHRGLAMQTVVVECASRHCEINPGYERSSLKQEDAKQRATIAWNTRHD